MTTTVYSATVLDAGGGETDFSVHRYDDGHATITAIDADGMHHFCGRYPHMASAIKVLKVIANKAVR